jgi:hypothetical protein
MAADQTGTPEAAALNNLPYWLWRRGKLIIIPLVVWFCVMWWFTGWSDAWDMLVGRATPRNAPYPFWNWPLSVAGWLVIPAFIGAIAGYVISSEVEGRRKSTMKDEAQRVAERATATLPATPQTPEETGTDPQ